MSTPQFGARVISLSGRTLVLQVLVISEDSALPTEQDADFFARMLAFDEREGFDDATALEQAIEEAGGDMHDEEWMNAHVRHYIRALSRNDVRAFPSRASALLPNQKTWKHEEQLPSARFTITLTDPRFAAHLKAGDVWESTTYADELWADDEDEGDDEEVGFFARIFRRFGFELV